MNSNPRCSSEDGLSISVDKLERDPPQYYPITSCGPPCFPPPFGSPVDDRSGFTKSIVSARSCALTSLTPIKGPVSYDSAFHRVFPGYSRMFPVNPSHAAFLATAGSFPPTFFSAPPQDFMSAFAPSPVLYRSGLPFLTSAPFQPYFPKSMETHPSPELRSPPDNGPKKCHVCEKSYTRMSTLKLHMRAHSGEKPYQCLVCLKSFSQAANLTAHFRIHSGEKPFKCRVCNRRFSQSSSVTTHMRTHNGERPYKCTICVKAFADSSTLTKHTRTHTGEKPYQCDICLQRFSQSGNLNRHKRIHSDC